jgi:hypothetical protein
MKLVFSLEFYRVNEILGKTLELVCNRDQQ